MAIVNRPRPHSLSSPLSVVVVASAKIKPIMVPSFQFHLELVDHLF